MTERRPPSEESEFGGERFAMREVRAVESDEAPELPRRTWVAVAAILAVVAVVAVGFWWVRVGANVPPGPEDVRRFEEELSRTEAGRQELFQGVEFETGTRLILQLDPHLDPADADSRELLRQATREALEAFRKLRPNRALTAYGYQGEDVVTHGEYRLHPDPITKQNYFVAVEGGGELGQAERGPAHAH